MVSVHPTDAMTTINGAASCCSVVQQLLKEWVGKYQYVLSVHPTDAMTTIYHHWINIVLL
jgi:hypothetical protein